MNRDLYIHTLQGMRDVFAHEHMDTQVEATEAAIQALQTQTEVFLDGTLSITVADISQIRRVLVSQSDTQYGTLYYADGGKMMDLIDRQTAIDALMEQFKRNTPVAIRAKLTVEGVPSAQPEIIRCKDCKRFYEDRWCIRYLKPFLPDDFCSYAERRKDG